MAIRPAISLVTLGVRDLAAATRFYEGLGFPLSSASVAGEVSFFRTAGGILALWGADALAADANVSGTPAGGFRGCSLAINAASRGEVDAALETAAAASAQVLRSARETDWGGYQGYFADLDGHVWEVAHNPFWPLDDRGLPQLPD